MKIEKLSEISPQRMAVKIRSCIRYNPKLRANYITERKQSAFMYIINGDYEFYFDSGSVRPKSGDTVYLPEGMAYGYRLLSESAECAQIEFVSLLDGEPFSFSTHPSVVESQYSERAKNRILSLSGSSGMFEKTAVIFDLFNCFDDGRLSVKNESGSRILPAIRYIEEHCTERIYVEDAARLCFISESQLRRLFESELGMSPIEFKNNKRMELAINMLKYTYMRISEIAESVGFENIYVFSRVFTKHFGMSPTKYRNGLKK